MNEGQQSFVFKYCLYHKNISSIFQSYIQESRTNSMASPCISHSRFIRLICNAIAGIPNKAPQVDCFTYLQQLDIFFERVILEVVPKSKEWAYLP